MKNNPTLARKASNTMKTNAGLVKPHRRSDQAGDGADFAFNGQMGDGVNRMHGRDAVCANPNAHLVKNPDAINHGLIQSNRRGNASDSHADRMTSVGPSATKDANRHTVATASQGGRINGGAERKQPSNPDKIYITKAAR
jgi:hypothetical protein